MLRASGGAARFAAPGARHRPRPMHCGNSTAASQSTSQTAELGEAAPDPLLARLHPHTSYLSERRALHSTATVRPACRDRARDHHRSSKPARLPRSQTSRRRVPPTTRSVFLPGPRTCGQSVPQTRSRWSGPISRRHRPAPHRGSGLLSVVTAFRSTAP